jgi:hypothetical protein
MESIKKFECVCGKQYTHLPNLSRHRKTCEDYNKNDNTIIVLNVLEQNKLLQQQNQQLQEQNQKILQDQVNQLQEQVKQLQEQLQKAPVKNKTKHIQVKPLIQPVQQLNKKPSVKTYLEKCNPITYTQFMSDYIPEMLDYSNVIQYNLRGGIVKNIIKHLSTYNKTQIPIIITNIQNIRLRMLVYNTESETENKWKTLYGNDASAFLEKMIENFVFKLQTNKLRVFNQQYPGVDDSLHPDCETHRNYSCNFIIALRNSEQETRPIMNIIKEQFCIVEEIEESDE